jgi:hypothetical protein
MSMGETDSDRIQDAFKNAQAVWSVAIDAHRLAPPDSGFSSRLASLSGAARIEAKICREAQAAGFAWPPHKSAGSQPWELQPGSGRRGPAELWRAFDDAVLVLERAAATTDLLEVARGFELLGDAAAELAEAVRREDRASGLLSKAQSGRSA